MPVNINRPPRGLNSLLQLQSKGHNPNQLQDQIFPGVDLSHMFLADLGISAQQASGTITAAGAPMHTAQITIPAGELWLVWNVSSTSNVAANIQYFSPALESVGLANQDVLFCTNQNSPGASLTAFTRACNFSPPLPLNSGTVISTFGQFVSTDTNVATRVLFHRLTF